jgi:hypothetical protein
LCKKIIIYSYDFFRWKKRPHFLWAIYASASLSPIPRISQIKF